MTTLETLVTLLELIQFVQMMLMMTINDDAKCNFFKFKSWGKISIKQSGSRGLQLLNNWVNQNQSNFTPFADQDLVSATNKNQKPKSNQSKQPN